MPRTSSLLAVLLVASSFPPANAQTEFHTGGLVYSVSGFAQRFFIEDEDAGAIGVEIAGMPAPEFGFSFGFGQTTVSQGSEGEETATSITVGASFIANQTRTSSPLTAEVGAGLGYVSGRGDGAAVGLAGVKLSLTLDPKQPVLVIPSFQGSLTFPLGLSEAEQTFSLSPGIGVGLRLARGFVAYARPNYTFVFGGEEPLEAVGVAFGVSLLQ